HCTCSRERIGEVLKGFSAEDRADMLENGIITVTCEFCSTVYHFTPEEAEAAPPPAGAGTSP
ncbi:MAG: Hsp33 family molecular chaperone HslO, partial [Hyphomicrobiales bacterium]